MYIVKNLKDYKFSVKQRIFAGYLKERVDSYVCYEKVTNRAAMRKYLCRDNDLVIYSTAVGDPSLLIQRYRPSYSAEQEAG